MWLVLKIVSGPALWRLVAPHDFSARAGPRRHTKLLCNRVAPFSPGGGVGYELINEPLGEGIRLR